MECATPLPARDYIRYEPMKPLEKKRSNRNYQMPGLDNYSLILPPVIIPGFEDYKPVRGRIILN